MSTDLITQLGTAILQFENILALLGNDTAQHGQLLLGFHCISGHFYSFAVALIGLVAKLGRRLVLGAIMRTGKQADLTSTQLEHR